MKKYELISMLILRTGISCEPRVRVLPSFTISLGKESLSTAHPPILIHSEAQLALYLPDLR